MGSSGKKKKEKQKDFLKPKFKVGKAKAKPSNFTDTSFRSKAIVVGEQYHSVDTPEEVAQAFKHQLSLAATARSDRQRRDALIALTDQLAARPAASPVGTSTILARLLPLISDSATPVRSQLLKLLRCLPAAGVRPDAERVTIFVRAGMTHLSTEISNDGLAVLDWLLDVAADEAVSCPGGWVKTLTSFCALMGWSATGSSGWTSAPARPSLQARDVASRARQLATLTRFLQAGLRPSAAPRAGPGRRRLRAYWDHLYRLPSGPQSNEYLNLFGGRRDEDGEMYSHREARQRVFRTRFEHVMQRGADIGKKDGGTPGRAAAGLDAAIRAGMLDYEPSEAVEVDHLMALW